jgi:hypothetical protein
MQTGARNKQLALTDSPLRLSHPFDTIDANRNRCSLWLALQRESQDAAQGPSGLSWMEPVTKRIPPSTHPDQSIHPPASTRRY